MKAYIFLVIFSFAVFGQSVATDQAEKKENLPTVKEIFDRYVEVIGGRKAREAISNIVVKGKIEFLAAGSSSVLFKGDYEAYAAAPNKSFVRIKIEGMGEMIDVFDGQRGWTVDPMRGKVEKIGLELQQASAKYFFYRDISLDKLYQDLEVKGIEKIDGSEVYVVRGRLSKDFDFEKFYFDKKTGFLLRHDEVLNNPEGKMNVVTFFEDMRQVGDIKYPYKVRSRMGEMFDIIVTASSVELNTKIDDKIFSEPK